MVRDVFRLARENAPSIIFIDEIDAIATKRFDAQTGADREVQRILMELLTQMDGFDQSTNVKVSFVQCFLRQALGSMHARLSWRQTELIRSILHCYVPVVSIERSNFHLLIADKNV
jgi:SpoVK/Ycf46/Vps4 family AAA+-type ATPase